MADESDDDLALVGYPVQLSQGHLRLFLDDEITTYCDIAESDVVEAEWLAEDQPDQFARLAVRLAAGTAVSAETTTADAVLAEFEIEVAPDAHSRAGLPATRGPVCGVLTRHPICFMTAAVCVPVSEALCPTPGCPVPPPTQVRCPPAPTRSGGYCEPSSVGQICPR